MITPGTLPIEREDDHKFRAVGTVWTCINLPLFNTISSILKTATAYINSSYSYLKRWPRISVTVIWEVSFFQNNSTRQYCSCHHISNPFPQIHTYFVISLHVKRKEVAIYVHSVLLWLGKVHTKRPVQLFIEILHSRQLTYIPPVATLVMYAQELYSAHDSIDILPHNYRLQAYIYFNQPYQTYQPGEILPRLHLQPYSQSDFAHLLF